MDTSVIKFEEFPQDDQLWWIRWVDEHHYRNGDSGTPGIKVYLSKISEIELEGITSNTNPSWKFKEYQKKTNTEIVSIKTNLTNIQDLIIGRIFKNGRPISSLLLSATTISTDTSIRKQIIKKSSDAYYNKPKWLKAHTYYFLPQFEYALEQNLWKNSKICVLQSNDTHYLIPCSEILRYFYFWRSEMVRIFSKGPWKDKYSLAVNEKDSGLQDGIWAIKARTGFTLEQCKLLAPLYFDRQAFARANSIYINFLEKTRPYSSSYLNTKIPFRDGPIELKVKGVWLQNNKYLVMQIVGHTWPYEGIKLQPSLDNSSQKGRIQVEIEGPAPFSSSPELQNMYDISELLISTEDPKEGTKAINVLSTAPQVEGVSVVESKKEISGKYERPKHINNILQETKTNRSTGNPQPSGDVKKVELTSLPGETPTRFNLLINAFCSLYNEDKISSFRIISPPTGAFQWGKFSLWTMPKIVKNKFGTIGYTRWTKVTSGNIKRPRTALVVEVILSENHRVYIIEIEPRNGKFRALILRINNSNEVFTTINDYLRYGTVNEGKWGAPPPLLSDATSAEGWKHTSYRDSGELHLESLLKCMHRL